MIINKTNKKIPTFEEWLATFPEMPDPDPEILFDGYVHHLERRCGCRVLREGIHETITGERILIENHIIIAA